MQASESQHLLRTTQHTLDDLNEFAAHHLRLKLANDTSASTDNEVPNVEALGNAEEGSGHALTVRVLPQEDLATPRSELHADTTQLEYSTHRAMSPSFIIKPASLGFHRGRAAAVV